jgi:Fe-S oxidoreductase
MLRRNADAVNALRGAARTHGAGRDALLIGCTYATKASAEARDAAGAAAWLTSPGHGEPGHVELLDECCGLPLLHAGDAKGFAEQARRLAQQGEGRDRVLVADGGCAHALRVRYAEHGVTLAAKVELLVEVAARDLSKVRPIANPALPRRVRYHDSCHMGRGLGVYAAPRAVLTRALGRAPDEFAAAREHAVCSGGGGGLPLTMPEVAAVIAEDRARRASCLSSPGAPRAWSECEKPAPRSWISARSCAKPAIQHHACRRSWERRLLSFPRAARTIRRGDEHGRSQRTGGRRAPAVAVRAAARRRR